MSRIISEKFCVKCQTLKPISEWHRSTRSDGLASQCKECKKAYHKEWYARNKGTKDEANRTYYHENEDKFREYNYKKKYGITINDYEQMASEQNGVCAICSQPEKSKDRWNGKTRRLAVDHCHKTGRVRGLLCYRCNHLIGCLGDDVESFTRVLEYLKGGGAHE